MKFIYNFKCNRHILTQMERNVEIQKKKKSTLTVLIFINITHEH